MTTVADKLASYKKAFENLVRPGTEPTWLKSYQESHLARFLAAGFPGRKDEAWRYTNLRALEAETFVPYVGGQHAAPLPKSFKNLKNQNATSLVFIDGLFSAENSSISEKDHGVTIVPLEEDLHSDNSIVKSYFNETRADAADGIANLNAAFTRSGIYIRIHPGTKLTAPIQIFYLHHGSRTKDEFATLISPRNIIIAEANSQASIDEIHIGGDNSAYFVNAVSDIRIKEGTNFSHRHVQLESDRGIAIGRTTVTQDRDSRFHSLHFSFGGRILRHDLNVVLGGIGAETKLDGLYAVKSGRHIDHHTVVEHAVPQTRSRQVYKGIIHDGGKSTFNGKVLVHKDAQKTDAAQLNKNLLLGDKAEANTKPELMILADDVKCSHGATVGQLNEDEVFYLESRAIPRELATKILVRGYAEDVLDHIDSEEMKNNLKRILMEEFF